MPIRPEHRGFYPIDWRELSHIIRFERAGGRCERCARPHGERIWHLGEQMHHGSIGLWWDGREEGWRAEAGRAVALPPLSAVYSAALRQGWFRVGLVPEERLVATSGLRRSLVVLACCHLDHDPFNNAHANIAALCQRCHLKHDAAPTGGLARHTAWSASRSPDVGYGAGSTDSSVSSGRILAAGTSAAPAAVRPGSAVSQAPVSSYPSV